MPSTSTSEKPITLAQLKVLKNLMAGREAGYHLSGRSAFGGLNSTLYSLIRNDLITPERQVTKKGYEAVALHAIRNHPLKALELVSDAIMSLHAARKIVETTRPDNIVKPTMIAHFTNVRVMDGMIRGLESRLNAMALDKPET